MRKANFNPNLHLNELNPDRNMYRHVDWTDLLVNSTEFCFTPMRYFEIDSVGCALRPPQSGSGGTVVGGIDSLNSTTKSSRCASCTRW